MALYPTWQRYLKLWKTVIRPIVKQNINVEYIESATPDEEYDISTKDTINNSLISNLSNQIFDALLAKDYSPSFDKDWNIIINGKDDWAPYIEINIFSYVDDDDTILYGGDDLRGAAWGEPQDDFGFNLKYSTWMKERGLVDNYDNIRKAPKEIQKAYCDYCRAIDFNHLCIRLDYVE
jgi:hypothetical protein